KHQVHHPARRLIHSRRDDETARWATTAPFSYVHYLPPEGEGNRSLRPDARLEIAHLGLAVAFAGALELAAGGEDVAAARRAHRGRQAPGGDDLGEAVDAVIGRALVGRAGPRVERDQVHLGVDRLEQAHQLACVGVAVVDTLEHHVLEGDAPAVLG